MDVYAFFSAVVLIMLMLTINPLHNTPVLVDDYGTLDLQLVVLHLHLLLQLCDRLCGNLLQLDVLILLFHNHIAQITIL